jgi:predicted sulfurtransferase
LTRRASSTPISIAKPAAKRQRKDADAVPVALLQLKEAQLAQTREFQRLEIKVRKREVRLREKDMEARQKQMENEARAVNARIEEANAQTFKLRQDAEHWCLQRNIVLLREKKLLDEG